MLLLGRSQYWTSPMYLSCHLLLQFSKAQFFNHSNMVSSEKDIPSHARDEDKLSKLASSSQGAAGVSKIKALHNSTLVSCNYDTSSVSLFTLYHPGIIKATGEDPWRATAILSCRLVYLCSCLVPWLRELVIFWELFSKCWSNPPCFHL